MKKFLKYLSIALIGVITIVSCSDDDFLTVNPDEYKAAIITTPSDNATLVLTEDKLDSVYTFSWSKAEYGSNLIPMYALEITTKDDTNFTKAVELTANSRTLEYSISFKDLNAKVLEFGLEPDVEHEFIYRVVSTLGTQDSQLLSSAVQTIAITAYSNSVPMYWGIAGDATPNGWNGPDTRLIYDGSTDSWSTTITLKDGAFKFRQNDKWELSYGGTAVPGVITKDGGADIKITAGTYKITANFTKETYSVEAQ